MKQLLLTCCLLVAACTMSLAQSAQVSKTVFNDRVIQLNNLLNQGKTDEANAAWNEVNQMMMAEMASIKQKMRDAVTAQNQQQQTQLMKLADSQYALYAGAVGLHVNMTKNKKEINTKLTQFGAAIL